MTSFCNNRSATGSGVAGRLISVALVLCCSTALADSSLLASTDSQLAAGLAGSFSGTELQQLEYATAAEATAARVAAMQQSVAMAAPTRKWRIASSESAQRAQVDVFQHSGQLLPLLVTRPQVEAPIVRPAVTQRPGLVQPVGVAGSSLR